MSLTCSGLAMPYDQWLNADPRIDPPDTLSLRFRPGAFAGALRRPDAPRSNITIDHIVMKERMRVLWQPTGCSVEYWEEADGLHFEARGIAGRVHSLIEQGWITRCCLEMLLPDGSQFPQGTSIEVSHVPMVLDLALMLFCVPHARRTSVIAGPAVNRRPVTHPVDPAWSPRVTRYRIVNRACSV